jgi:hypothetical protein
MRVEFGLAGVEYENMARKGTDENTSLSELSILKEVETSRWSLDPLHYHG